MNPLHLPPHSLAWSTALIFLLSQILVVSVGEAHASFQASGPPTAHLYYPTNTTTTTTSALVCPWLPYPKQYVVFRLEKNEAVTFDGKLDEGFWAATPWSSSFVDITTPPNEIHTAPTPFLNTRVKMRWDDECLYVGAEMEEPQAYATKTVNNSRVFEDPAFEVTNNLDG